MTNDDSPAIPENSEAIFRASMQDEEVLSDFVVETSEHLGDIEVHTLALEKDAGNGESINALLRAFHTIKGLAGILEFEQVQQIAHEAEGLLERVRDGNANCSGPVIDAVLASADYLRLQVKTVEARLAGRVHDPIPPPEGLLSRLQAAAPGHSALCPAADGENEPITMPPDLLGTISSVRVETEKLDRLMDLVGEMIIAQTQVRQHPEIAAMKDGELAGNLLLLSRITREVQHSTMALRMVPVLSLFKKTARLVRDLSRRCGKNVILQFAGEETELDKKIAEDLADPMMHMVRNAIDHGIEGPEERLANGKQAAATLRLAAYHQGGQIVIEVGDDGRGLGREGILRKALQNGLIEKSHADALADDEVYRLIFEPGFSTAEAITNISGRGVGMDVVREQVHKLHGHIEIASTPGKGTRFLLKMPLTLAIVDALVVSAGDQRYLLPISSVRQIFRPQPPMLRTVMGREMVLFQQDLLPIERLYRRFAITPRITEPSEGLLILAEAGGKRFCLLVDELVGRQEVVIKALDGLFQEIAGHPVNGVSSCAILGNGQVGLVLDPAGLWEAHQIPGKQAS